MPSIIIQAANKAGLTTLIATRGLIEMGEGAGFVPGVAYSFIGSAAIPGDPPITLPGVYGMLNIEPSVFGETEMQILFTALQPHRYTGTEFAPLREVFGGTSYNPDTQVPFSVTMRQARLALLGANKLVAITSAIESLPEPTKSGAKITWEYSTEVQRYNGLVSQLAPVLGISDAEIDALFIAASKL